MTAFFGRCGAQDLIEAFRHIRKKSVTLAVQLPCACTACFAPLPLQRRYPPDAIWLFSMKFVCQAGSNRRTLVRPVLLYLESSTRHLLSWRQLAAII